MQIDVTDTVLIVTGSELGPEEKDRPLAYTLKSRIDSQGGNAYQKAIVVSDRWFMDNPLFHACAAVLVGGPGVNTAAAEFYNRIPVVWTGSQRAFVHFTLADKDPKAAVWGMNQAGTEEALEHFLANGYLERFLNVAWRKE
ncbi:MAG: hypothetical protein GC154_16635 [bacterium]|nr:hypothetical protein [bacterium]